MEGHPHKKRNRKSERKKPNSDTNPAMSPTPKKRISAALFLLCLVSVARADSNEKTPSFIATITPLGANDDNTVTGTAVVFAEGSKVAFAGLLSGAPPDLDATMCDATNGCGVHVHAGTSCTNSTTQGGHYFNAEALGEADPWRTVRYSSDANGGASFSGILADIGETATLEGRAFLVHAEDGSRIGCGVLTAVATPLVAHLSPLNATQADVQAQATFVSLEDESAVCFYGTASGLEPSLTSSSSSDTTGTDCTATNGCGVHIHSGTDCTPSDAQGGHLFNDGAVDPWLLVGYPSTDAMGNADFVHCVATPGVTDYIDRPFIVHANDGSRVSCGLLETVEEGDSHDPDSHDDEDHSHDEESSGNRGSLLLAGMMISMLWVVAASV